MNSLLATVGVAASLWILIYVVDTISGSVFLRLAGVGMVIASFLLLLWAAQDDVSAHKARRRSKQDRALYGDDDE